MPLQHVVDEALGEIRVRSAAAVAAHNVIHDRQGRHQLGSRALGQQRAGRIRDFDHQQAARLARLPQTTDMFSEQRIEMAGYPSGGVILQPLLDLVERDDFRSRVQKQSLTVTCRFVRAGGEAGC